MEEKKIPKARADFETDSEYWTYRVTHPDEYKTEEQLEEEEEEKKALEVEPYGIFQCVACGFIIDEFQTKPDPRKKLIERLNKCPKCGKRKFRKISKERKKEIELQEKKKEKKQQINEAMIEREKIQTDVSDLLEDLTKNLLDKEITVTQFVNIFVRLSFRIANHIKKELPMDWISYRKYLLLMSDDVLEHYEYARNSEQEYLQYQELLDNGKESVEKDTWYTAYEGKYIEDNEHSIHHMELSNRVDRTITEEQLRKMRMKLEKDNRKSEYRMEKEIGKSEDLFRKDLLNNVKKI